MGSIVKKITKAANKLTGGLLGKDPAMPQAVAPEPVAPAPVEAPKVEQVEDNSTDTESDKKRVRATGKKSLSVSRNSGAGINV
ncbi:host range and adsorption protein [Enterobacter phage phiEap-1]|uniref:Tail assembly protein n=1 Tax=Enterobacter phage phiEap-1 TaxID=1587520 RepID=A0A0K2FGB5_9CAUD|nr:host range and adsorption protein [Enterobacter phage phiEap-1]ALA45090.1 hypothetical protein RU59_00027 [Enterobacter phage phiEap-1]